MKYLTLLILLSFSPFLRCQELYCIGPGFEFNKHDFYDNPTYGYRYNFPKQYLGPHIDFFYTKKHFLLSANLGFTKHIISGHVNLDNRTSAYGHHHVSPEIYTYNYLGIGTGVNAGVNFGKKTKFYLSVGPSMVYGILLGGEKTINTTYSHFDATTNTTVHDSIVTTQSSGRSIGPDQKLFGDFRLQSGLIFPVSNRIKVHVGGYLAMLFKHNHYRFGCMTTILYCFKSLEEKRSEKEIQY
jgi:hypothetical protein